MNWSAIIGWVIGILAKTPDILNFTQKTLDASKTGLEVFKAGQGLLDKDKVDNPEQLTERARAVADMTRSYAPFAFAEVLFYAIKTAALVVMFKWIIDLFIRRDARRLAREMLKEQ